MGSKGNFNKAMFDMFGVGGDSEEEQNPAVAAAAAMEPDSYVHTEEPVPEPAPVVRPAPVQAPVQAAAPIVHSPLPEAPRSAVTYLAPGTYMEGTLKAKGDVEIAGTFKGDIIASGNVTVRSGITGNITAANLEVVSCVMTGDARIVGSVLIDEKSAVEGNVYAKELVCAGKVKGDIHTAANASFQQNARVEGNISTGTMVMDVAHQQYQNQNDQDHQRQPTQNRNSSHN